MMIVAAFIVLSVAVAGFGARRFERAFRRDAREELARTAALESDLLKEQDLGALPGPVRKYLRYTGAVGKPRVKNMRAVFRGTMRGKKQDWFAFTSEQYNFFDEPTRLFFMKAKVKGLPAQGYHAYRKGEATMFVKALSLFPVANFAGEEMFLSETVTMLNDMCLLAPGALIDERIKWETLGDTTVKAIFTNRGVSISAILHFNEEGQLVDFVSDDRYEINEMKQYRFSTPVSGYQEIDGKKMMKYGEAVWHYPEGPFVYGRFYLENLEYNVEEVRE